MEILYKQIIVAFVFIILSILASRKAIHSTPSIMRENNQQDIDAENKAKLFEELSYLSLICGAIFVFLIA